MKKLKWLFIVIAIIITISVSFFITDYVRMKNAQPPVFVFEKQYFNDGGSVNYIGVFYTIHRRIHHAFKDNQYSEWHIHLGFPDAFSCLD